MPTSQGSSFASHAEKNLSEQKWAHLPPKVSTYEHFRFVKFYTYPERHQLGRNRSQLLRVLLDGGVNAANSQMSEVGAIHISAHSELQALLEHLPQTRPPVRNKRLPAVLLGM
jgi:hypothetical protein